MRLFRHTLLLLLLLPSGCAPLGSVIPFATSASDRLAGAVTIARDEWGVPHVFGESDAATAFGLGYAQAEDAFPQLEEDLLHALGRASHWYGERYLASDLLQAAFEVQRLSREEYEREPADRRAIWDAFADGINYYIAVSGTRPRLITHFEPWMPFALARAVPPGTTIAGVELGVIVGSTADGVQLVGRHVDPADSGTSADVSRGVDRDADDTLDAVASGSMWAVGPSRSESGRSLLLHQETGPLFSSGSPWEMMIHSADGWHVRGHTRLGLPVPAGGHNARAAWSHTSSDVDAADLYELTFDTAAGSLRYAFDGEWRTAAEWEDTLRVNSPAGVVERVFRFRRTHHGPVVAERDGVALAARVARVEEGGSLQQLYAESRAASLEEFRAALDQRALRSNVLYADVDGNIFYLHGGAVPVRAAASRPGAPLDGSTSASEWGGYLALSELPQVLNPASGWIVAGPGGFMTTLQPDASDATGLPPRAGQERLRAAAELLAADPSWTSDEWAAAAFDVRLHTADAVALLIAEWERVGGLNAARARRLDVAVDTLRSWDRAADVESSAATLYILWQEQLRTGRYMGEYAAFRAMEEVLSALERDHGSPMVAWGEVNRLQRTVPGEPFSDERPSLPMPGAPAWAGSVLTFDAAEAPAAKRRYGVSGTRWTAAVELSPQVRFRSVVPSGQSTDAASGHWFDQAPLHARGELKSALFLHDQVMANARRIYRPGDAAVRELP